MCGLTGGLVFNSDSSLLRTEIELMNNVIIHRGPNDDGVWCEHPIAFGHRRLSILDLSPAGHQPMLSKNERFSIVYNGEIYNFDAIRQQLEAMGTTNWRGHSDTEIILEAISVLGFEQAVSKFNGMFAIGLWDRELSELKLARDRFGEKPLYYYIDGRACYFASEVRCFEQLQSIDLDIDQHAVGALLQNGCIGGQLSIYQKIRKVEPATVITISSVGNLQISKYWDPAQEIKVCKQNPFSSERDAIEALHEVLLTSVKMRMESDVPLGAFLSGGIDSSTIVALMQSVSDKPVNTFSIGFHVDGYNEAQFAKNVALHLGTKHHEKYLTAEDAINVVPKLGAMFDEPFADSSQIPMYLVSKMAKERVTVCLSGDGGDELFCGYKRYSAATDMWKKLSPIPCRNIISKLLKKASPRVLEMLFFFLRAHAEKYGRKGAVGLKIKRFADWIMACSVDELYQLSMQHWHDVNIMQHSGFFSKYDSSISFDDKLDDIERMMLRDTTHYLPNDILTKVDRATMAVSLESRIPLLDPAVFSVAWRMPVSLKQKNNHTKWPLKQILHKYVPEEMFERPKLGFGVPIHIWLKNELRDWAEDLLDESKLQQQGFFNADLVRRSYTAHLKGAENNASKLWNVLMFQAWLESRK
ncbi:asparagine synthase (glutamine-hydrolyzing) [Glaciecola sp. SC05]|uniref:asparagine synthase (glutamine-hydrolyzing) n=1 Tax=Glaciecola sp. SC05 TaxID=1987355 RepID=UPI003528C91D